MIKLPCGVDLNDLIDDLRNFSWEASDILLYYANIIKNSKQKNDFLKNKNKNDPVTLADLEVNELIIKRINQKYKDINWEILSEENFKINDQYLTNTDKAYKSGVFGSPTFIYQKEVFWGDDRLEDCIKWIKTL